MLKPAGVKRLPYKIISRAPISWRPPCQSKAATEEQLQKKVAKLFAFLPDSSSSSFGEAKGEEQTPKQPGPEDNEAEGEEPTPEQPGPETEDVQKNPYVDYEMMESVENLPQCSSGIEPLPSQTAVAEPGTPELQPLPEWRRRWIVRQLLALAAERRQMRLQALKEAAKLQQ
jgi:hypothetical protein